MVYGILKFINFAHSDIVVLGAWISFTLSQLDSARDWARSAQPGDAAAVLGWRRDPAGRR